MIGRSRLATKAALLAIRAYRRYLSPLKGFSCALRAIHGGDSCSVYGYRAIRLGGLAVGLRLLEQRLALCAHVYRKRVAVRNPLLRRQQGHCDLPCDVPHSSCGGELLDCAGTSLQFADGCSCGTDLWDRWRNRRSLRRGNSQEMDALERRIRERRERR